MSSNDDDNDANMYFKNFSIRILYILNESLNGSKCV